jgi:hypothetical protein
VHGQGEKNTPLGLTSNSRARVSNTLAHYYTLLSMVLSFIS